MCADTVTPKVRSRMMAGIRSKDTKPEMAVRSALHCLGFRFRLHRSNLPGKPDLVFPKYRAVILIHGCFWHGHNCHLFKWPKSHAEFWRQKIGSNISRDQRHVVALMERGWRVATIWECALKGKLRLPIESIAEHCAAWLKSSELKLGLRGNETRTIA